MKYTALIKLEGRFYLKYNYDNNFGDETSKDLSNNRLKIEIVQKYRNLESQSFWS